MAYSLADALVDLKAQVRWLKRVVAHEPLDGLVDGVNKLLYLPFVPGESGSLTIHNASGTALTLTTDYAINYSTGAVTFVVAPTDVCYGSYTALAISDSDLTAYTRSGFAEMQKRYNRTLYLVTSGASVYVSSDAAVVTDPSFDGHLFSASDVQKRLYLLCCRYVLLEAMLEDRTLSAKVFRESGRISSLSIDDTKQPANILAAMAQLDATIAKAVEAAMLEADETVYGEFIPGAKSDEYYEGYQWWPTSKQGMGVIT